MKITKEEISLCRRVAEKHRKEIKYGDWYISIDSRMYLWLSSSLFNKEFVDSCEPKNQADKIIPLWTISDCLEFLKSKSFYGALSDIGSYYETHYRKIIIGKNDEDLSIRVQSGITKTPLEACLKTVLAVLEEEK